MISARSAAGTWVAAGALAAVAALVGSAGAASAAESAVQRVAGSGRVETAVQISKGTWTTTAPAVVIARADDFADALTGSPLAAQERGPLLLSGTSRLSAVTRDEIRRLSPEAAYVLGGPSALSQQVLADLTAAGVGRVVRIAGADRFETAARLAARLRPTAAAYVAVGSHPDRDRAWPDAVAVSGLAARQGRPILLVAPGAVPAATERALGELGIKNATVVGGTAAVGENVAEAIAANDVVVDRLAGATRFETARLVAAAAVKDGANGGVVWLATGNAFPDALAAGAAVAATDGVLLLTPGRGLGRDGHAWLGQHRDRLAAVRLLGGPAAVSADVEQDIRRWATPEASGLGPYDPQAEMRPDLIRAEPATAAPGERIELYFPKETERGAGFVLEQETPQGWELRYYLFTGLPADDPQARPTWRHASGTRPTWPLVALTGPGPNAVEIPFTAGPGQYRICHPGQPAYCTSIEITAAQPAAQVFTIRVSAEAAGNPALSVTAADPQPVVAGQIVSHSVEVTARETTRIGDPRFAAAAEADRGTLFTAGYGSYWNDVDGQPVLVQTTDRRDIAVGPGRPYRSTVRLFTEVAGKTLAPGRYVVEQQVPDGLLRLTYDVTGS